MSVQPKGVPAQRQAFLRELPQLHEDATRGSTASAAPVPGHPPRLLCQAAPRAHNRAQSLKGQAMSTLETNLLLRGRSVLVRPGHPAAQAHRVLLPMTACIWCSRRWSPPPTSRPAEAQAVGLARLETQIHRNGQVDIELGAEPEISTVDIDIAGLPAPEAVEPTSGKSLADNVQIGFAYQMHLEGSW